jgi:hypothetical protein
MPHRLCLPPPHRRQARLLCRSLQVRRQRRQPLGIAGAACGLWRWLRSCCVSICCIRKLLSLLPLLHAQRLEDCLPLRRRQPLQRRCQLRLLLVQPQLLRSQLGCSLEKA